MKFQNCVDYLFAGLVPGKEKFQNFPNYMYKKEEGAGAGAGGHRACHPARAEVSLCPA